MSGYVITKALDDFYSECVGFRVTKLTPAFVYIKIPLWGMVTREIEIPWDAVEIEVDNG
jgi:hypothetical protein